MLECHTKIAQLSALNKTQPTVETGMQLTLQYDKLRDLTADKTRRLLHKLKATAYHQN
ncbi:Hypothetical predicted protein, partial [Pelobates cultripes]